MNRIYMDNAATTRLHPEVLAAMKRNRVLKSVYSLSVISSINGIPKTSVPNCGISTMPVYIRVKVYVYSR